MPLTHVCMWTKHGWKRVTAREAEYLHPSGTVSARSGLFMCEICGQSVSLTDGNILDRYFKHSKEEKSKDCPERTFGASVRNMFQAGAHELPIRINIASHKRFELELGFLLVPTSVLGKRDGKTITIRPVGFNDSSFVYSFSRLNGEGITYLSIGDRPAKSYKISISSNDDSTLSSYWPSVIEGIEDGAVFDKFTRKKLLYDADVHIDHTYYVLTRHRLWGLGKHISATEICTMNFQWEYWRVYEVTVTAFEEDTARFFLDYHCRLTECPVMVYPLWPVYVESPYLILHKDNDMKMFFQGDAKPKLFPEGYINNIGLGNAAVLSFQCGEQHQMLSAGRTKVLEYLYIWKDELDYKAEMPMVTVKDINDEERQSGEQNLLPKQQMLMISAPFDGTVIMQNEKSVLAKYALEANKRLPVHEIKFGIEIQVLQGLDCVWTVNYIRKFDETKFDETKLLKKLQSCRGNNIVVTHAIGAIAVKMHSYPKVKQWLYKKMRQGFMSDKALLLLKNYFK